MFLGASVTHQREAQEKKDKDLKKKPQKQQQQLNGNMMNLLSLQKNIYALDISHYGAHKYNHISNLPSKPTDDNRKKIILTTYHY